MICSRRWRGLVVGVGGQGVEGGEVVGLPLLLVVVVVVVVVGVDEAEEAQVRPQLLHELGGRPMSRLLEVELPGEDGREDVELLFGGRGRGRGCRHPLALCTASLEVHDEGRH